MSQRQRRRLGRPTPLSGTTTDTPEYIAAQADFAVDRAIVGASGKPLWAMLFDDDVRLSIRCSRCGRWLTSGPSKRAGIGEHCAAQAKAEAVQR